MSVSLVQQLCYMRVYKTYSDSATPFLNEKVTWKSLHAVDSLISEKFAIRCTCPKAAYLNTNAERHLC